MAKRRRSVDAAKGRQWRERIKRYEGSGQTVRKFCRSEEVKESAFYWWKRRLGRCRVKQSEDPQVQASVPRAKPTDAKSNSAELLRRGPTRFLPVQLVMDQASEPGSGVEIRWDSGRSVRLDRGFDRQALADVMAILEARPC